MNNDNLLSKYNAIVKLSAVNKNVAVIATNIMHKYQVKAMNQRLKVETGPMCCKWCLNSWTPGFFSVQMQAQKQPKRRIQSMLKKDYSSLNKYQQKLVDKINKRKPENSLVISCVFCQRNTSVPLHKGLESINEEEKHCLITEVPKKKKRRKKDIFAGLNAAAVQSVKKPVDEDIKKVKPKKVLNKKPREISYRQQLNIHRAILQTPTQKKKPSLLDTFLSSL